MPLYAVNTVHTHIHKTRKW